MLRDALLAETLFIANTLLSLYSFDIFSELALRFTGPPDRQVTFEDVVDLLQSSAGCFWVGEEDVECHRSA